MFEALEQMRDRYLKQLFPKGSAAAERCSSCHRDRNPERFHWLRLGFDPILHLTRVVKEKGNAICSWRCQSAVWISV